MLVLPTARPEQTHGHHASVMQAVQWLLCAASGWIYIFVYLITYIYYIFIYYIVLQVVLIE